jgi:predicted Zn-dependent protease
MGGRAIIGAVLGSTDLVELGSAAADLVGRAYDRDQEREADQAGRALLQSVGVEPRAMASFFARMREQGELPGALQFLSTHPSHDERIASAEADAPPTVSNRLPPLPPGLACHRR